MAMNTRADAAIGVGFANAVAGKASEIQRAFTFSLRQDIWGSTHGPRVVFFGERDLLNGKRRRAEHGSKRRRRGAQRDLPGLPSAYGGPGAMGPLGLHTDPADDIVKLSSVSHLGVRSIRQKPTRSAVVCCRARLGAVYR